MSILSKIFGSYSEKEVKRIMSIVDKINLLEPEMKELSESELRDKTAEFKKRISDVETLDDILPEAYAVVREASMRVLGMRHFDVQLIGGIILHQGRIAEMKTGEGKTLVATLPIYLNALTEKGVHLVTVNDYLAKYQGEMMGKLYRFLGLTVGLIVHGQNNDQKREAYACDITYGTNNEYGFDYLRDNMVTYKENMVQRDLNYAIVDEIDSILIDEARTPLIISGTAGKSSDLYKTANEFVKKLRAKIIVEEDAKSVEETEEDASYDYIVDLKAKTAALTQKGIKKAEQFFNISNLNDMENTNIVHHVNNALKAHGTMKREREYVVNNGEVIIVDEFTGRLMQGRRYSDGLHQAIEAKEGVKVENESKTLATVTFQNYFRMYKKLAGMTGTALTEEAEFREIYNLDVITIPTNKPMIRTDKNDIIYKNEKVKFKAVIEDIKESNKKGQPVLVGTISIEKSEQLSNLLKKDGIKHEVLNAKYHAKEAEIVAQAGKYGAVTIATNMAGRGTDILLGGNAEFLAMQEMRKLGISEDLIIEAIGYNETDDTEILNSRQMFKELKSKHDQQIKEEREKVIQSGGLKIIGTERHESRRIDNQLRGRAGRQGDSGESRFYISLEDDLMKIFGGDMVTNVYNTFGADENMPIEMKLISNAIESAQRKVEGRNFSTRKHVLQYDDVMNTQREIIYGQRREVLDGNNIKDNILKMVNSVAEETVMLYTTNYDSEHGYDREMLSKELSRILNVQQVDTITDSKPDSAKIIKEVKEKALRLYDQKENSFGFDEMREVERMVMLRAVDERWMDHIDDMDQLKNGIGLRAYGQKDPVVLYRIEGFDMFDEMIKSIKEDVVGMLLHIQKVEKTQRKQVARITSEGLDNKNDPAKTANSSAKTVVRTEKKVGRNDPCTCGSGKKYKQCCGKAE